MLYLDENTRKKISRYIVQENDVCLAIVGHTIGLVFYVEKNWDGVNLTENAARITAHSGVDPKFLFYYLLSPYGQEQIRAHVVGSAQGKLPLYSIQSIEVPILPIAQQKAIADLLSALDDKIELNRQMNETLDAIATSIYKSWFVDFDPVRAKMDGRKPYGMNDKTTVLFPSEFEDSVLGKIPIGWRVGRLDDLLVLQRGYDLPTNQRTTGSYPVMAASGPAGTHSEYKVKGPGVITGRSGLLGKVFYEHENFWPLNTSLFVKEYRNSSPIYAYYVLKSLDFEVFNAGSAVPTLNRNHVHNLPVIVPPKTLIANFEDIVFPIFRYCYQNEKQSQTLASIRDALLPKLLSGEIRVKDAEKYAEALL